VEKKGEGELDLDDSKSENPSPLQVFSTDLFAGGGENYARYEAQLSSLLSSSSSSSSAVNCCVFVI
jgi:hypothetical protein